jgi:hypothetical protein
LFFVAEMVLAELPGRVPKWLEQLRDRRILRTKPDVRMAGRSGGVMILAG